MRRAAWLVLLGQLACGARTALPTPDTTVPPFDASSPVPANRLDCPSPDQTLIYLVTDAAELWSFLPTTQSFQRLGPLNCPVRSPKVFPFSMAVDRHGIAYVEYADQAVRPPGPGGIFRVQASGPTCTSTLYDPSQSVFSTFGMGFATDQGGPAETLYVAEGDTPGGLHALGTLETSTFTLTEIAAFKDAINGPELTGTGDGRLFAFSSASSDPRAEGAFIAQLDKNTGRILGRDDLPTVTQGGAWAFAFWGGKFYLFTSPVQASSVVTEFDPTTQATTRLAPFPDPSAIVGAGVSTCAPE